MAQSALRVCQFNCLAPSARICAPLDGIPWRQRHAAVCDTIAALQPAIVTVQEFDFGTDGFADLWEERLGETFSIFTKKRTGGKKDGLALLVRTSLFDEVSVSPLELEPRSCDRVALVGRMRHIASGRRLVVVNTHLTVAHASNDYDIPHHRPLQMKQVLGQVEGSSDVVIIGADLNSDHLEPEPPDSPFGYTVADVSRPVHMAFEQGFVSALHSTLAAAGGETGGAAGDAAAEEGVPPASAALAAELSALKLRPLIQRAEAAGVDGEKLDAAKNVDSIIALIVEKAQALGRPISHTCSYAQDGCCDYVLVRGQGAAVAGAFLHPADVPPDTEWDKARGWQPAAEAGEGELQPERVLSDHRPLITDLTLEPQ